MKEIHGYMSFGASFEISILLSSIVPMNLHKDDASLLENEMNYSCSLIRWALIQMQNIIISSVHFTAFHMRPLIFRFFQVKLKWFSRFILSSKSTIKNFLYFKRKFKIGTEGSIKGNRDIIWFFHYACDLPREQSLRELKKIYSKVDFRIFLSYIYVHEWGCWMFMRK